MTIKKVTCGASVTNALYDELMRRTVKGERRSTFYNRVILNYVDAWKKGKVARVYIGAPDGKHRSFQVHKSTADSLHSIAEADGVSVSMVARTAIAFYIYQDNKIDPWGTDAHMPQTRKQVSAA